MDLRNIYGKLNYKKYTQMQNYTKGLLFLVGLLLLNYNAMSVPVFKKEQLRYARVRKAYNDKESIIKSLLSEKKIEVKNLNIYIRAFKYEQKIELWGKNKADEKYVKIKEFSICAPSGSLGPKRKQGDLQVPEGFYHINVFNPYSNFYLSLGINYPNKSDRILGEKSRLGGDIYIHGSCVTIGCIPLTDSFIKELYIYCVEAKNNGQLKIPVTIFPAQLTKTNLDQLKTMYPNDSDKLNLWDDLKKGYDYFNTYKKLPAIKFLNTGRHQIN